MTKPSAIMKKDNQLGRLYLFLATVSVFGMVGCGPETGTSSQFEYPRALSLQPVPLRISPQLQDRPSTPGMPVVAQAGQNWEGFSSDNIRFASCTQGECRIYGDANPEIIRGNPGGNPGNGDHVYNRLSRRGFSNPNAVATDRPRYDWRTVAGLWEFGADLEVAWTSTNTRINVLLRERSTGAQVPLATFESPNQDIILWRVVLSPNGRMLAVVSDSLSLGRNTVLVNAAEKAAQVYRLAANNEIQHGRASRSDYFSRLAERAQVVSR